MCKKLTKEEFIERSKKIHGNKYDYSLVDYINNNTKVKIICLKCNKIFEQTPNNHLNGKGCKKCRKTKHKMSTIEFIARVKEIWGDVYDYNLVEYNNLNDNIKIICKIHGVFKQKPKDHLRGCGCRQCGIDKTRKLKIMSWDDVLTKFKKIYGNEYDYSESVYLSMNYPIAIICKNHGIFYMLPKYHLHNGGCPKCSRQKMIITKTKKIENVLLDFRNVHGDNYDYSQVEYINSRTKIKIICKKHGIFEQTPNNHLRGECCPKCKISLGENKILIWLNKNKIKFEQQKEFDGCQCKFNLKFDFYLSDYNICIEYDGGLHFKPVVYFGGEEAHEKTKMRDQIKNDYCKNNNIKLFRIPYWKFNDINYILKNIIEEAKNFF